MNSDIKIITVDKHHEEFQKYCNAIEAFSDTLPDSMKRIKNYRSDLKINESVAVSIYEQNSIIIGFSSVLHRDMFGNGVRVLNRLVKTFDYRFPSGHARKLLSETKVMIAQQIDMARKYNFDYVFISRESNSGSSALKHFFKELPEWKCPPEKFRVCGGGQQCEQYVAWLPLNDKIDLPLVKIFR
jgi:hypothetical protein